ncbi:MAG: D-threonate/D-erythronate kinase [Tepidanaerobacteraceae bacterium]|nr:D-threonate/D-erythronate kinase [Tepidanaerobacteraceae bacterium]
MFKVIIIADDFTGSNDTGVQLAKYGYLSVTMTEISGIEKYEDIVDALVIDTETRSLPPLKAYETLKEISSLIARYKDAVLYKKIDSTLRGNIGAELKALRESLKPEIIVFAPAFPKNGRTTRNGIHYLNGVPVDKTELAKDPKNPVTTSDVKKLLEESLDIPVRLKKLEEMNENLAESILQDLGKYDVFAFDVATEEDLVRIAEAVLALEKKALWVGSAGLAEALMVCLEKRKNEDRILVVAGSVSQVTRRQIARAAEESQIALAKVDVKKALINPYDEIKRILAQVLDFMDKAKDVIIASALEEKDVTDAIAVGNSLGLSSAETSEAIARFMGEVAHEVVKARKPAGMVLTGGDTAIHVVKKLSATGCRINSELEPGIPQLVLIGGVADGVKVVTKAGAFGNDESIVKAVKFLKNR